MQSVENSPLALRKPRRNARIRKTGQMQGQTPKLPNAPEAGRQQSGAEFTARAAGDWPPNTWWP